MSSLREGYTTGTCAAAAAKAALMVLCGFPPPESVEVALPDESRVSLPVLLTRPSGEGWLAAVRKSAGDDPDVTNGMRVEAEVSFADGSDVLFVAGEGVGTVTKPGLSIPPGEPAINPVPRRMIRAALAEVCSRGVRVKISIPGGREIAERTFNPRLGIVGGLSILGTMGKVRPFSVPALIESLKCSLSVAAACGVESPVLTPGNIGERAARNHFRLAPGQVVQAGNYWGAMLDETVRYAFTRILIVGHPGKLAKLINGNWDTHSANSPGALPAVLEVAAAVCRTAVPESQTVEGVFQYLAGEERSRLAGVLSSKISESVTRRVGGKYSPAVVLINMSGEILGSHGDLAPWL